MRFPRSIIDAVLFLALAAALIGAAPAAARLSPASAPIFTVNSLGDAVAAAPLDSGPCETATGNHICPLRAAIMKANHWPGGGATVLIPAGTYILILGPSGGDDETIGDLNVTASMTITGASAANTILDAATLDRMFSVETAITVTISNVMIRNGYLSADGGGGIRNLGTLILNSVEIARNSATLGGGIFSAGPLTINNSTVHYNQALQTGGGIVSGAPLLMTNSTVSNNSARGFAGGLVQLSSPASLYFSTVAGNLANSDGVGGETGGGIYNSSTFNLRSSLVAENFAGSDRNDCAGDPINSQGYNLLQTTAGCSLNSLANNVLNKDPLLEPPRNNGGPTFTRGLLEGSPAINAVPTGQCLDSLAAPLTRDQRGSGRPSAGACDIGAFEGQLPVPYFLRNLIRNGDAETSAGSTTGNDVGVPNWLPILSPTATVGVYGAGSGFPDLADPGPADRGFGLFAGGLHSQSGFVQTITVTAISAAVNTGLVHYDLSGYFGGFLDEDDSAQMYLLFLDGDTSLGDSDPIGNVAAAGRNDQTGLLYRATSGQVPAGTTKILVVVAFTRVGSGYNNAYADNLSLVLGQKVFLPLLRR